MQNLLPVLLAFLLLCFGLATLLKEYRQQKMLRLRVKKLYASQLFEDMTPLIRNAKRRQIEQLSVDKTGVVLRYLHCADGESAFLMRPNGYQYLTMEQQEALRVVLEECLPALKDANRYHVSQKRVRLLNGNVEYVYLYTMSNAYKARLMRAQYYDGTLQTRSW